jgi:integrase/recombinase XerD
MERSVTDVALPAPTVGEVERVWTKAQFRNAEKIAAEADDPWLRSAAWRYRWLRTYSGKPGTVDQYERVWVSLEDFAVRCERAPIELDRDDIEDWLNELRTLGNMAAAKPRPLGTASMLRMMSAASSFYGYCMDDPKRSRVERNPVPQRNRPKADPHSRQQLLTRAQVSAVIDAAQHAGTMPATLVGLLLMGLRVTEACTAKIEDMGISDGYRVVTVTRKGGHRQRIRIPDQQWKRITAAVGDRKNGPILLNGAKPMGRRTAYNTIAALAERADIPGKVGPHTFRHAVVTHALKDNPLHVVQAWVGHENPRTTERYWRDQQALDNSPAQALADSYYGTPADGRSEV